MKTINFYQDPKDQDDDDNILGDVIDLGLEILPLIF